MTVTASSGTVLSISASLPATGTGTWRWNSHIRQVSLYNRRLTNAELVGLTT